MVTANTYLVFSFMPNTAHVVGHIIFTTTPWSWPYYHLTLNMRETGTEWSTQLGVEKQVIWLLSLCAYKSMPHFLPQS